MWSKTLLLSALAALVQGQGTPDLATALGANPDLSQLAGLVKSQPSLLSALGSATNITVLAPNNAAIGALLNSSAGMNASASTINALLSYHVLKGTVFASQITNKAAFVPTLLDNNSTYSNVTGGQRVGAVTANNNVTILSGLLQNSTVTTANQNFTGGTIHIINKVLTIPSTVSNTLVQAGLSSLYGALNASSLLNTVNGLRDVTIFAPNNAAFAAIGSAVPNISIPDLQAILGYHVANGTSPGYSSTLTDGQKINTGGGQVTIRIKNGTVFANNAKVVTPDVLVAGGVVHVIDEVLNPKNATATVPDNQTSGAPAFSGASSASNTPFTSGVPSATGGAGGSTATSSSSKAGAALPMRTGAVGAAALFGAGAIFANL